MIREAGPDEGGDQKKPGGIRCETKGKKRLRKIEPLLIEVKAKIKRTANIRRHQAEY